MFPAAAIVEGNSQNRQVSLLGSTKTSAKVEPCDDTAKVSDLSNFAKATLMIFGLSGVFAGRKDIRRRRASSGFVATNLQ
jgi:hypothetical protein